MFHAHQDDVVEQQEIAQVRDLEDRPAQGARGRQTTPGGRLRPYLQVAAAPKTGFSFP